MTTNYVTFTVLIFLFTGECLCSILHKTDDCILSMVQDSILFQISCQRGGIRGQYCWKCAKKIYICYKYHFSLQNDTKHATLIMNSNSTHCICQSHSLYPQVVLCYVRTPMVLRLNQKIHFLYRIIDMYSWCNQLVFILYSNGILVLWQCSWHYNGFIDMYSTINLFTPMICTVFH